MGTHQHGWHPQGLRADPTSDGLDDDVARLRLVGALDLDLRHGARDGHGTAEVVGMGGAQTGDVPSGLREGRRVGGVRVDDATDVRILLVEPQVRVRVAGRAHDPLQHAAVRQRDDHEVFRLDGLAGHAAGLDDECPGLTVHAAGVAPREHHQPGPGEVPIGLTDLLTQDHIDHDRKSTSLTDSIRLHTLDCARHRGGGDVVRDFEGRRWGWRSRGVRSGS